MGTHTQSPQIGGYSKNRTRGNGLYNGNNAPTTTTTQRLKNMGQGEHTGKNQSGTNQSEEMKENRMGGKSGAKGGKGRRENRDRPLISKKLF